MSFNLSAIAVRERAVTLFFIILLAAAGAYAFLMLGRAEDPSFTIKHVAGLVGAGLGIGGIRQLPEMCGIAAPIAPIQARLGHRADRRTDGFGKRDDRFARTGLCQPNDRLAGGDYLSRLAKRLGDRSVGIRHQDGIGRLILGYPGFGFGRGELRVGCVRRGLRLLVPLSGCPPVVYQVGVSPLIRIRLNNGCTSCGNGVALRGKPKAEVGFVDPHQRLPGFYLLADVHKPFDDLAGDAKTEIAFHPRAYGAGETAFGSGYPRGRHEADHRRFLPRVTRGGGFSPRNS